MKTVKKGRIENIKNKFKEFFIKHKPVTKHDWIRFAVLSIAIPVFIFSSTKLIIQIYTYISEDRSNQQIINLKPSESKNPFDSIETSDIISIDDVTDKFPYQIVLGRDSYLNEHGRLAEYQSLWEKNNDMVGWFYFPNTPRRDINYPILQAQDNIFYLNYDFNKNRSYSGSIYMDYRNNSYAKNPLNIDRNYIITGHAMKDFTMFGNISGYWHNETSQKNARLIYVDLMNTKLQYEVFSTFVTYPNFNYKQINFANDQEYLDYLNIMVSKSTFDFGIEVGVNDKIVTLETCYLSDRRTIIVGRLIRQIIYEIPEMETGDENGLISRIEESEAPADRPSVTPVVLPTDIPVNVPFPTATPPVEDTQAAEIVMELIDMIEFPVTVKSRESILAARTEYNKLTTFQKTLVENYEALTEAEAKLREIDNKLAAKEVSDLIDKLPGLDKLTLNNKTVIWEANTKYNSLTVLQKKLVLNFKKLEDSIAKIKKLEVDELNTLIKAIPEIELIELEHKEKIMTAKTKYDALDKDQKEKITEKDKLVKAVSRIMVLEVDKLISELPEISDISLEHEEQILKAKEKYDILTENEKAQVLNYEKLEQALDKINSLKPTPTPTPTESTEPLPTPTESTEPLPTPAENPEPSLPPNGSA